jgi:hypothetical protein
MGRCAWALRQTATAPPPASDSRGRMTALYSTADALVAIDTHLLVREPSCEFAAGAHAELAVGAVEVRFDGLRAKE